MKKPPPYPSFLSSIRKTPSAPAVLLFLLHVMTLIGSYFTFSSWTIITWILFIPYYLLLWIASVIYVLHWHRRKNLEENEKEEQIRALQQKGFDESDKQTEQFSLEREKLSAQEEFLRMLLLNSNLTEFSCDDSPILGKNVHVKFEKSEDTPTSHPSPKVHNK